MYPCGKKDPVYDPKGRTLCMAKYAPSPPPLPEESDWSQQRVDWGMHLNDQLGTCVVAAAANITEVVLMNAADSIIIPDPDILIPYEAVGGYVPGNDATDNGLDIFTFMKYWRAIGVAGRKLKAFVALEPGNVDHVKMAIHYFGACLIGVQLPKEWFTAPVWSVPLDPKAPMAGGHGIAAVAYNRVGIKIITWNEYRWLTWAALAKFCDEGWLPLLPEWVGSDGLSPSAIDAATLLVDLAAVTA